MLFDRLCCCCRTSKLNSFSSFSYVRLSKSIFFSLDVFNFSSWWQSKPSMEAGGKEWKRTATWKTLSICLFLSRAGSVCKEISVLSLIICTYVEHCVFGIWSKIYLNLCCRCKLSDKSCNITVLGHNLLFFMQWPGCNCLFSDSNIFVSICILVLGYVETEASLVANWADVTYGSSGCGTLFWLVLRVNSLAKDWTNFWSWL